MSPSVTQLAFVDITYSPDDEGWYAEIYNHSGKTLHITELYPRRSQAQAHVIDWCRANRYRIADTMNVTV
jgi:hypothetical protein